MRTYVDNVTACRLPVIQVQIDIKPGSNPNAVNTRSKGVIPVAVLTTDVFDAADVDVSTIRLGDGAGNNAGIATRKNGTLRARLDDVDSDGDLDLIMHFATQELVDSGALAATTTTLTLTGQTVGGTAIEGSDSVRVVK